MIVGDVKSMVDDIEHTVFTDAKYGALQNSDWVNAS